MPENNWTQTQLGNYGMDAVQMYTYRALDTQLLHVEYLCKMNVFGLVEGTNRHS